MWYAAARPTRATEKQTETDPSAQERNFKEIDAHPAAVGHQGKHEGLQLVIPRLAGHPFRSLFGSFL